MLKSYTEFRVKLFVAAMFLFFGSQTDLLANNKIVGGEKVETPGDFVYKHTVRLLITAEIQPSAEVAEEDIGKRFSFRCSGSIIADDAILTAAHCFPDRMYLRKNHSSQRYWANISIQRVEAFFELNPRQDPIYGSDHASYVQHPDYKDDWFDVVPNAWNPESPVNDIAVVFLQERVPHGKRPVSLIEDQSFQGIDLTLAGFGRANPTNPTELPELRKVEVPYIQNLKNGTDFYIGNGNINDPKEIPSPKGGCFGDSGGPAFIQNEATGQVFVAGVIARGPSAEGGGCHSSLTIATDVRAYIPWIDEVLSNFR